MYASIQEHVVFTLAYIPTQYKVYGFTIPARISSPGLYRILLLTRDSSRHDKRQ